MHKHLGIGICLSFAVAGIQLLFTAPTYARDDTNVLLIEVERFDNQYLAETRETCAEGKMAAIKQDMDHDVRLKGSTQLPPVDVYCRKVLTESAKRGRTADLYISLALQEQGYQNFHSADQAQLLKNNESGRTLAAILHAASSGEATYTSITGKPRDLPCPLAFDAGYAWATANSTATIPVDLTQAEAEIAARQCYTPGATHITLHGVAYPAQKAGLFAGAWLAKR